jgi:hypothetical protein
MVLEVEKGKKEHLPTYVNLSTSVSYTKKRTKQNTLQFYYKRHSRYSVTYRSALRLPSKNVEEKKFYGQPLAVADVLDP